MVVPASSLQELWTATLISKRTVQTVRHGRRTLYLGLKQWVLDPGGWGWWGGHRCVTQGSVSEAGTRTHPIAQVGILIKIIIYWSSVLVALDAQSDGVYLEVKNSY
jgi:hypothetical protein